MKSQSIPLYIVKPILPSKKRNLQERASENHQMDQHLLLVKILVSWYPKIWV